MRVVLSGGGTGGHVYPALAVAEALARQVRDQPLELLYVGGGRGVEARIVQRAGFPFVAVRSGQVRGRSPWRLALSLGRVALGTVQALRTLRRFRPQVVFATGGYASVPVAVAAWLRRIPLVVYLPDLEPGLAVRLSARLASRVAFTSSASRSWLRGGEETGYPVRAAFFTAERTAARDRLGLEPTGPVLLVSGASQGAHSLNRAVAAHAPRLLRLCQVLHLTGARDEAWMREVRAALPLELQGRYHLYAYLDAMAGAMAAADLAVTRSGASTLGELPAAGLPAILVPYPYAGRHQVANASLLVEAGAAEMLADETLEKTLADAVERLLADPQRLGRMATAARALARPEAARTLARLVLEVAA